MATWYENPIVWYCAIAVLVGCVVLFIVFRLGQFLAERNVLGIAKVSPEFVERILAYYQQVGMKANLHWHLAEANRDFLQRRNEFWTTYLQVVVAVLIVIVLALLLFTKTISSEAGLPILSAVAGFAISKSTSSNNSSGGEGDRGRQG
jgi:hypothetical protein